MADGAPTPPRGVATPSCPLSSQTAAAVLHGLAEHECGPPLPARCALTSAQPPERQISALMAACASELESEQLAATSGSRKDKSLGLLCDNFLQLFATGEIGATIELEIVAGKLSVGRRRIYDIVNVLESLEVVKKGESGKYAWLAMTCLRECVDRLEREWTGPGAQPLVPLLEELTDKENGPPSMAAEISGERSKDDRARKEKSIRELAIKFIGLFMQAAKSPTRPGGNLSLELAARSLLIHERAGIEPDAGAMKTKVRRLYDICNVLVSMKMLDRTKLKSGKPAFRWLGVTEETQRIFDRDAAKERVLPRYGGSAPPPPLSPCGKRRASAEREGEKRPQITKRKAKEQLGGPSGAFSPAGLASSLAPPVVHSIASTPAPSARAQRPLGTVMQLCGSLPLNSPRVGQLVPRHGTLSFVVPEPSPQRRGSMTPPPASFSDHMALSDAEARRLSEASTVGAPTPQPLAPARKPEALTPKPTPGTASAALLCLAGVAPASAPVALRSFPLPDASEAE